MVGKRLARDIARDAKWRRPAREKAARGSAARLLRREIARVTVSKAHITPLGVRSSRARSIVVGAVRWWRRGRIHGGHSRCRVGVGEGDVNTSGSIGGLGSVGDRRAWGAGAVVATLCRQCFSGQAPEGMGPGRASRQRRIGGPRSGIHSCAGPTYPSWATDWPPLAAALCGRRRPVVHCYDHRQPVWLWPSRRPDDRGLAAAANTEKGRIRVRIWNEALEAHRAGRIRTAEVRGSDYLGARAVTPLTLRVLPKVVAGKRASVPADLDAPHSWTYTVTSPAPCSPSLRTPLLGAGMARADRAAEVVP